MSNSGLNIMPKDYKPYVRAAMKEGWTLATSRGGHTKLRSPDGYSVPVPSSSNGRGLFREFTLRLAEHGVILNVHRNREKLAQRQVEFEKARHG